MIPRLLLFIFGIVFNLQVWGYAYDVVPDVSSYENIEIEVQNKYYDDASNLYYSGRQCINSYSPKKTRSGPFFAFDVGLFAAKGARGLLTDPNFIRRVKDVDCTDCDDLARLLFKASGGKGKILDLTNATGSIRVREFGKLENFVDHRVFSDGKFIFDPRFSNSPVPINKFLDELRSLNPNLVIRDITP